MILQVFADARELVSELDARLSQRLAGTDAGKLQDLQRADGTGREHDLAAGLERHGLRRTLAQIAYAGDGRRAAVRESQGLDMSVGDDLQVRARLRRLQERFRT